MTTQLTVLENLKPVPFFTKGDDVDDILEKIKKDALLHVPDVSTGKGRSAITANITRVTDSKTYLETEGKALAVEFKAIPAKIDKNRKKVKEFLAELQIELRKPLTDWEAEQEVIKAEKLLKLEAEMLAKQIANDEEVAILMDEKFDRDLSDEKARIEEEAKQETARLAKEKLDSDALIAKEAAEQATINAERLAQQAIDDAQAAKQKAIDDKIKADNEVIASKARAKLLEDQAAQTKLNNEWLVYISEAYEINMRIDADRNAKIIAKQAETKRLADIETAKQTEIKRQKDELKAKLAAQAKLEANQKHVGKIRGEIKVQLMTACGLDNELATKVVKALLHIDQVTINY